MLRCSKGLTQGGVLSPLLYTLYTRGLEASVEGVKMVQFADDVCIYRINNNVGTSLVEIENAGKSIQQFLGASGLDLAPEKCNLVVFSKSKKIRDRVWSITLNDVQVQAQHSVKVLGIYFEADHKWNRQIQSIEEKCLKPMTIIRWLRSTWWGADPELLTRLYTALIRSRIVYGDISFYPVNKNQEIRLERIQTKAIKIALGLRSSTPNNVTLGESKIPPLKSRIKFLGRNYLTKAFALENNPIIRSLEKGNEL
ncbi:uncharacterized protein [Venturia canescens]|uniref:uncharacterized protein n=1 Tax=Venturia canescens TaxID=32260 RepID=UPI001C9C8D1F|nr:uncharacterized protein LOC122409688 [Venturia canescens]